MRKEVKRSEHEISSALEASYEMSHGALGPGPESLWRLIKDKNLSEEVRLGILQAVNQAFALGVYSALKHLEERNPKVDDLVSLYEKRYFPRPTEPAKEQIQRVLAENKNVPVMIITGVPFDINP